MILEYAEARAHHCGPLARMLRSEHRGAIMALGFDPHRELRAMFEASSFARAVMIDGRLSALGGILGSAIASEGHVWLAVSARVTAHPRLLLCEARRQLRALSAVRHGLTTTILDDDAPALRFACHLGFVRANISPMPRGLTGMRLDLRSLDP